MAKGWLVESAESAACESLYYRPCPFGRMELAWTKDHEKALRLARYEDAETLAASLPVRTRIAEHAWD